MVTWVCAVVVAAGLAAGAPVAAWLDAQGQSHGLISQGNVVAQTSPHMALLTVMPGGLRAWALMMMWVRAE